jgi:hypothetical protein
MYLTSHDGYRAWKSFDWDALSRLYKKGYIINAVRKAKSVGLTVEGLKEAECLFEKLFSKDSTARASPRVKIAIDLRC